MKPTFANRAEAGRQLASRLTQYADRPDVVVLGLPRGGVPVAYEVARQLHAPLDVFLVRKLGVPGHEELAMGAIASGGVRILNEELLWQIDVPIPVVDRVTKLEECELRRREQVYRSARPSVRLEGKTVLLVDDGIATGSTMRAALRAVRAHGPAAIVVAVPAAAAAACFDLAAEADEVVSLITPEYFRAVGEWYVDFSQTSDAEVVALLSEAGHAELPARQD